MTRLIANRNYNDSTKIHSYLGILDLLDLLDLSLSRVENIEITSTRTGTGRNITLEKELGKHATHNASHSINRRITF